MGAASLRVVPMAFVSFLTYEVRCPLASQALLHFKPMLQVSRQPYQALLAWQCISAASVLHNDRLLLCAGPLCVV